MSLLSSLKNSSRFEKKRRRVGRGPGSGVGKTSGRGQKGAGSRSGYKRRYGTEGGQVPMYLRLPTRGFSNERFRTEVISVNLREIDAMFEDGETVNLQSLKEHGYVRSIKAPLKILGDGELTKKVTIEAHKYSEGARAKLDKAGIKYTEIA